MFPFIIGLLICFTAIFLLILAYFSFQYTYWKRRNVTYVRPTIPLGAFTELITKKKQLSDIGKDLYDELKSKGCKYGGIYFIHEPVFMPIDPALIKRILSSDFDSFSERGVYFIEKNDPLAANLFGLPTEPWRKLRNKLTPTFTSGKIKNILDIMITCSDELVKACDRVADKPVDLNDLSVRYTVDIIGCVAFGIECNSLNNPDELFRKIARRVAMPPLWYGLKFFIALMGPKIIKWGNLSIMEEDVKQFFLEVVEQNINYREQNNIRRNDFFQLLLDMKKNDELMEDKNGLKMDIQCMAAQTFVFFAAGFETSSMTINFCLFELAQNLEMQEKLRCEIRNVLKENNGKITYDGLNCMTYLDSIVQETLRKYPPLGFLNRVCTKKYNVPDSDLVIEKGTRVFISLLGLQRDSDYFPDADKFDPERFSSKNKGNKVPFTNMPFGEGRRICIGERFGLAQTKIGIASLISNFEFTLNPMTSKKLEFEASSFVSTLKRQVLFDVKKIDNLYNNNLNLI